MANSKRNEIHAYQVVFEACSFVSCFVVDVHIPLAREMSAYDFINCHKLVPASDELLLVVWVEFYGEDWVVPGVSVGQGAVLTPVENLN